ncbi:hypothetical protein CSAL01_02993 [Colletotrichum salicis]|uniref:Uncharacterized protein n=1 Tax=Colletotrichum salicis TaxID=1209931 RepID=A0A135SUR7_9PEZI|nr:hypothetical protein CSAL01_02993 [Colletotrichum salicis]
MANAINPTSIPPITQLREQLDYGDPHLPRCQGFYDSVRVFRKNFVTSQGWEGSTIHEWRIREHRTALAEMARAYLERHGNGQLFWPDDNTQGRANKLKYSSDGTRIKRIMQQLFWRLNLQQHRNDKYKKNKEKSSSVERMTGRGLSHEDPIDVDFFEDGHEGSSVAGMPGSSSSSTFPESTIHLQHIDPSVIDPQLGEAQQSWPDQHEVSSDPYRVPESPEIHVQNTCTPNQHTLESISSAAPNDDRQFAPYADMGPPPKRPRLDKAKSAGTNIKATKKPRADKPPIGLRTHRISPRKRIIRQPANSATPEQLSALLDNIASPEIDDDSVAPEPQPVADDVSPPGLQGRLSRLQATVETVTNEDVSPNAYADEAVIQLRTETEMHQSQPEESCHTNEPSAPMQPIDAALDIPLAPHPTVPAAPQIDDPSALPEIVKSAEAVVQKPTIVNQPPKDAPVRQLEVDFVYRVVTSHPTRQSCTWEPEGSFRSKTLAELVEELPKLPLQFEWSELKCLLFRLEARNTAVQERVHNGREAGFESLKRILARFIRECIAETPPGESVSVFLEIEPLTTLDYVKKAAEVENIDFSW